MGKCIKCGVIYCDCPSDGICPSCEVAAFSTNAPSSTQNCEYSRETLLEWDKILSCALTDPKQDIRAINVHLGYVRSSLNIHNDYCRFRPQLQSAELAIQNLLLQGVCH